MFEILEKRFLNDTVCEMQINAPLVAKKAEPGQFIILRTDEDGERIPLTIAGFDRKKGTVKIIFQVVGSTTEILKHKNVGDCLQDFVGPLGNATETEGVKNVCVVGGGVGCAIAMPVAEKFAKDKANVTSVIGFRNKDLVILEDEFKKASKELVVMTDDGSYGRQGNVCVPLEEMLASGKKFDKIFAIGPLIMMKFVVETAKKYNVPCMVSMNPIMIDGTGMCGGCRLSVDGQMKFACVDGPDFDGYKVDFDEMMSRNRMYADFERHKYEETCNLYKKEVK
ncbi:MAG: sulfide/dihydroorotate dehydrogenase-like FAD/NAD-binding protein [Clostridia bacterium]|nr:sulfide/dihydroorotate dehydrogenase-like FAD/NAD-binding protein [Clostridia bacterium]